MSRNVHFPFEYLYLVLPDPAEVIDLPPEDLGVILLAYVHSQTGGATGRICNFWYEGEFGGYPAAARQGLVRAVAQARAWLDREGLIMTSPGQAASYVE